MISKGYLVGIRSGLNFRRFSGNEILIVISDPYSDDDGATVVLVMAPDGTAQVKVSSLRVISKGSNDYKGL